MLVILLIIIIGCLVYYLNENENENKNNLKEGYKNLDMSGNTDISGNSDISGNLVNTIKSTYTGKINRQDQKEGKVFVGKGSEIRSLSALSNKEGGPGECYKSKSNRFC